MLHLGLSRGSFPVKKIIEATPTTFLRMDIKSSSCLRFVNGIYISTHSQFSKALKKF